MVRIGNAGQGEDVVGGPPVKDGDHSGDHAVSSRGLAGAARHAGPQRRGSRCLGTSVFRLMSPTSPDLHRVYARVINGHQHIEGVYASASVLVVVLAVSRVPAPVVHIVDMIPVRDRDVATPLTVDMVMMLMHRMA